MPKYRALHLKIIDSFDFNEMPNDFFRVTWMLLTLVVDSAGRGIDNAAWIRSKMYPLREDVTATAITAAFDWFAQRGMIVRYIVNGKSYFFIPSFDKYQSHLEREAKSTLPAPETLMSNSGVTQEESKRKSAAYVYESVNESVNESVIESVCVKEERLFEKNELSTTFEKAANILAHSPQKWMKAIDSLTAKGATPEDITCAVQELRTKGYTIIGPWSIENAVINVMGKRKTSTIIPPAPGYSEHIAGSDL